VYQNWRQSGIRTAVGLGPISYESALDAHIANPMFAGSHNSWQQNAPATPDHSAALWEEEIADNLFCFIHLKSRLKRTRKRLVKTF